jgi:hypothetical protein
MVRDIRERFDGAKLTVISPDVGGVVRARGLPSGSAPRSPRRQAARARQ